MRRRSLLFLVLAFAGCGDDVAPSAEPPIVLPTRDASTTPPIDAAACQTLTDPSNCGACGNVCPTGARGAAACSNGKCVLTCEAGWGDCNGLVTDGCETDVTTAVDHCGACDRDCRACGGTTCTAGACDAKPFATRPKPITLLATDALHITYADDANISQIARADGNVESVYSVPFTPWLATTDDAVQFVYPGTEGFSGIYSTIPGFVGPQIAAYARGEDVDTFAFDDTGAYYASVAKDAPARRLLRCKSCSVPTVLSPTEDRFSPGAIALDATTVFFGAADMIKRVEKTSDGLKTIAVGQSPRSMAIDASYIYWINEADFNGTGEVARLPKVGGTVEKIVTSLEKPRFLVLAGEHLYIGDGKVVFRTAKDGTGRLDLARADAIGPIAVDQACVWFGVGPTIFEVSR